MWRVVSNGQNIIWSQWTLLIILYKLNITTRVFSAYCTHKTYECLQLIYYMDIKTSCFGPTTPWSKSNSLCLKSLIYAHGSRLMFYSFSINFIQTIYFDIYLNFITSGSSYGRFLIQFCSSCL